MAELKIRKMSEIQPEPVKWLWEPYIPSGKITLIQGDGSTGKTTLALAIAAAVSTGIPLPGSSIFNAPASVLVQNAEDGLDDTIRPRLEQFGGDCYMIHNIDDDEEALSFVDERIELSIIKTKARLCIFDPLQAFFRGANMNSANSVRPIMKYLGNIAARNDCAILLVGHLHKGRGKAAYRGLGSIDIYAAARSVLTVGGSGVDDSIRVMVHNKSNLAPLGKPQAFCLDPINGFSWTGEFDISVDDVMNGVKQTKPENQFSKARLFIEDTLKNGAVPAIKILQMAEDNGISQKTLHRAKSALGVISIKRGGQWYWQISAETIFTEFKDSQDTQDGHPRPMTNMSALTVFNGTEG